MKKIVLATVSVIAAAIAVNTANAADIAPAPYYKAPIAAYNWTGFYVGGNIGYGWGKSTDDLVSSGANLAAFIELGLIPTDFGVKPAGVIGGGQIGYNWQTGAMVWGLETDIQASGIHDTKTFQAAALGATATSTGEERIEWFGTARLRAGWTPFDRALLYVTGGLAYGGVKSSVNILSTPAVLGPFVGSVSDTKIGWTLGGGAEWAWTNQWSVKAEYLYLDLGSTTVAITDPVLFPGTFVDYKFEHREHIARVGLNYKF